MSTQWNKKKSSQFKLHVNQRLKAKRTILKKFADSGSQDQAQGQEIRKKQVLKTRTSLAHSLDLYICVFGMCFIPIVNGLSSAQVVPMAFQMTLAVWLISESWFWITSVLRSEGYYKGTRNSVKRSFWGLLIWLVISIIEPQQNIPLIFAQITFVYLWSETIYRGVIEERHYDTSPKKVQRAYQTLMGSLGLMASAFTLIMWRAHELDTSVELGAIILAQCPLLLSSSAYWLGYHKKQQEEGILFGLNYFKYAGFAILLPIFTILARHTDSLFRNSALILTIAGVMFFYVSYLLPNRELWSYKTRSLALPLRSLSFSFVSLCVLGTGLLMLPMVTIDGRGLSFMEAAFTSVSASCITGLSVIDLSLMSTFGQVIVLFLIQVGGFGIILLSHMLFSAILLRGHQSARSSISKSVSHLEKDKQGPIKYSRSHLGDSALSTSTSAVRLLHYVIIVEGLSALLLTWGFIKEGLPALDALWKGFFTSISAFCNAGFALQSDSFVSFSSSSYILYVISLTVIFGGLGPTVIFELIDRYQFKENKPPLSYFSKLILWGSLGLFFVPTIIFCILEWHQALSHLSPLDKISNAFFHSTSLRTAGFNSIDLSQLSGASWSLSMVLMIMGGSPLSTAGGIKVTTMLIATTSLISILRGRKRSVLLGRAHSLAQSAKALATLLLSLLIIFIVTILLQLLVGETIPLPTLLFEVVSALGTVGLSIGGTGMLSHGGLCLIMLCMFLGRVGPPALLLSLTEGTTVNLEATYLEENVPLS